MSKRTVYRGSKPGPPSYVPFTYTFSVDSYYPCMWISSAPNPPDEARTDSPYDLPLPESEFLISTTRKNLKLIDDDSSWEGLKRWRETKKQ